MFPEPADELEIAVDLVADMTVINPFDFFVEPYAETFPFAYAPALAKELIPFLETAPLGPRLAAWLDDFRATIAPGENPVLTCWCGSTSSCSSEIALPRAHGAGRADARGDARATASGSCRDSGWLLVQILRHLGIAARFASGYLIQLVADVKPLDGPAGTDRDFTDLHAWAEAYIPGAGWIGLDPTSGLLAGEGHIPLACTADPGQRRAGDRLHRRLRSRVRLRDERHAHPRGSARHRAVHRRAVGRRSTRWASRSTRELAAHDVRLTQGGEPTFVSIDDMDGPEWNYTALSPKKRELAETLLQRLAARFAPGRLAALRPGQVVSGRAAAALGARRLLARRRRAAVARRRADRRHDASRARRRRDGAARSASALAAALGLPTALRDHRLRGRAEAARRRKRRCRSTSIRSQADLAQPDERARLARLLQRGPRHAGRVRAAAASAVAGATAPTSRWDVEPVAAAPRAPLRGRRRFAARPAPAARSLPDVLPEDDGAEFRRRSVRAARRAAARATRMQARGAARVRGGKPREVDQDRADASRCATATCTSSCRRCERLEDYVALLAAIEDTARGAGDAGRRSKATRRRATRACRC